MRSAATLLLAWIGGGALGAFFFGGLWWTVRRAVVARRPALWIFGSLLFRTCAVLTGFFLLSGRRLDRLLLCVVGFLMARVLVTRLTRSPDQTASGATPEVTHAP